MQALKVGHATNSEKATGISVFLFENPVSCAYWLCGSAPATRDVHLLDLDATVDQIDGLAFVGGSAFGLDAVAGIMQWFRQQDRGYSTQHGNVPIVPAAGIYDLGIGSNSPPTAHDAYQACQAAQVNNTTQGRIGAGVGASVGKVVPGAFGMSGGVGYANIKLINGLEVAAYAVVNSLGDIKNDKGEIIAGATLANGSFANSETYLLATDFQGLPKQLNTTLIAIFTNGLFNKSELKRIAKMASAGMARAISPVFSRFDGDILFCASLGTQSASDLQVGAMAAEVVRQAIVNAVSQAVVLEKPI